MMNNNINDNNDNNDNQKNDDKKFNYTYYAPTKNEKRTIEDIRKQYLPLDSNSYDSKLKKLKALDSKVKTTPTIISISLGVIGLLISGLGMSMVLEWSIIVWGIVIGIIGCIPMALAYPVYNLTLKYMKKKYSGEILSLSKELLDGQSSENSSSSENS